MTAACSRVNGGSDADTNPSLTEHRDLHAIAGAGVIANAKYKSRTQARDLVGLLREGIPLVFVPHSSCVFSSGARAM
ncbi:unnamed protein product [Arctogadus glacialis]